MRVKLVTSVNSKIYERKRMTTYTMAKMISDVLFVSFKIISIKRSKIRIILPMSQEVGTLSNPVFGISKKIQLIKFFYLHFFFSPIFFHFVIYPSKRLKCEVWRLKVSETASSKALFNVGFLSTNKFNILTHWNKRY